VEKYCQGKTEVFATKLAPTKSLSTTNPIRTGLILNQGLRGDKPATNNSTDKTEKQKKTNGRQ
jgi:hypothetical protein